MHPASEPTRLAGDWTAEIAACPELTDAHVHAHRWSARYSAAEYRALIETHQDHILLSKPEKARLLSAVAQAIEIEGGIDLDLVTRLCMARRA
jgi:hypothetical protein